MEKADGPGVSTTVAFLAKDFTRAGNSYYQHSILNILGSILNIYGNIMDEDEKGLVQRIEQLPNNAQRLFFRIYLRKAEWIRERTLEYKDISDISEAMHALGHAALIDKFPTNVEEVVGILQLDELKQLAKKLGIKAVAKNAHHII